MTTGKDTVLEGEVRWPVKVLAALVALLAAAVVFVIVRDAAGDARGHHRADASSSRARARSWGAWGETQGRGGAPGSEGEFGFEPGGPGSRAGSGMEPEESDPQAAAFERSQFGVSDGGVGLDFAPTLRFGTLASVAGDVPVSAGAQCQIRVLPVRTASFNCVVRVVCDGVVIYPDADQHAGYAPCDVRDGIPIAANDGVATHADGDPAISIDFRTGEVQVHDESPDGASILGARVRLEPIGYSHRGG